MPSWQRCSSSRAAHALLLVVGLSACARARSTVMDVSHGRTKVALFPMENLSSATVETDHIQDRMERALAAHGFEVVSGDAVEGFLTRHRLRFTGGLSAGAARTVKEELGVGNVLVTSIEQYSATAPPKIALAMRLVSVEDAPAIMWMEGVSLSGNDDPGPFGVDRISSAEALEEMAVSSLAGSLAFFRADADPHAHACPGAGRFEPKVSYRSPRLTSGRKRTVAVLPFSNEAGRRNAGEVLALEFVRGLASVSNLVVVEPGVVREELLSFRLVMPSGVSLDAARVAFDALDADYVLAGRVQQFQDDTASPPGVNFSVILLERESAEKVWESTSYNEGNDGVLFFGVGRVNTATALACRMVRSVVDQMFKKGGPEH
jgi:TolB-like protein